MNLGNESDYVTYKFFGINLISNYPFSEDLNIHRITGVPDRSSPHVRFLCQQSPPFHINWEDGKLIFPQEYNPKEYEVRQTFYHFSNYDLIRFTMGADFYISHDYIYCHLYNPSFRFSAEVYLLGVVLAFWLEREGFPVLHTSAVTIRDRVVAFPSFSGNGKSTLAAAFIQTGAALFTDDILPIEIQADEYWGHPGLPNINLWPDQAMHFMEGNHVFEERAKRRVPVEELRNGSFCQEKRPLACIYIPSRSNQASRGIEIIPMPPAEAVVELLRYSFIPPDISEKLDWQGRRLAFFADLISRVPLRRLIYPSGFEYLSLVTGAVLRDIENLPM